MAALALTDVVALTAALLALAWLTGPALIHPGLIHPELTRPSLILTGLTILLAGVAAAGMCLAAARLLPLYDARTSACLRRGARAVFWLGTLATVLGAAAGYGFAGPAPASWILLSGATAVLATALLRHRLAGWLERHAADVAERVLLIGTADALSRLLLASRSAAVPQRIFGAITIGDAQGGPAEALAALDPGRADAASAISDFWRLGEALRGHARRIDRAVIATSGLDDAALAITLERVEHLPFEIALAPPIAAVPPGADPLDREHCAVVCPRPITPAGLACKRALDVVAASVLLVVLLPVLLVIAALIRIGSPGPALFRQARWGWNNETFTVYKFRTMWADAKAPDGSMQATRGDKRVTPIGRFLRSTSLDELPQLLNVLNGTMSLVGPRPHPVELNLRYLGIVSRYAGRHRVVPGITGLAQINGYRGETPTAAAMQQRVDFDLEYIRTRSFATDVWILFKTFGSVLRRVNAH